MGLFDRFGTPKLGTERKTDAAERDALDLISRGNSLEGEGQFERALQCYEAAIRGMPNLARAHLNRGNILLELGDSEEALVAYQTALAHNPTYAAAHYNIGNAFVRLGRREDAALAYHKAIALKPDFPDAEVALGAVLDDLGQFDAAVASYRRALAIRPGYAQAHGNLGNALKGLGQIDAAVASYRRALELDPDYAEGHNNLGNALKDLGQFAAAVASYRRALELDPDYAEGHSNLGNALKDLGQIGEAETCYRRALTLNPAFVEVRSNLLFLLNYNDNKDASLLLSEAKCYGDWVARLARGPVNSFPIRDPAHCLRVGFVSGDFRVHPVSYFFEGVMAALVSRATGRLEFFCYYTHFSNDAVTQRIKTLCHGWRSVAGLSDEALARRINDDAIDILVDLSGHTAHNRLSLFACKPAPLQLSWLGYFATTGVAAIDYLIADPWTLPQSEEVNFTEKVWRLPQTRLCFTPPDVNVAVNPLPALSNGYLTFGCFNNLSKMNDRVVVLWAQVLAAVPDSRLFLKSPQLGEVSAQRNVAERFAVSGIDPARLILEGLAPRADYLKTYQRVDIALDPFPYTGGTTTCEALWMGVPVLTLAGRDFLSRQGVGLLMNAGLPEWVAVDGGDYLARAKSHASDLNRLALLRAGLRQQVLSSPLFDAPGFAHQFELALRTMWQERCAR